MARGADEIRSWFVDDEAYRRQVRDERRDDGQNQASCGCPDDRARRAARDRQAGRAKKYTVIVQATTMTNQRTW